MADLLKSKRCIDRAVIPFGKGNHAQGHDCQDDLMMADLLEEVLAIAVERSLWHCPRTVEEGIELGEQHKPDLAILDMRLADGGIGMDIAAGLNRGGAGRPLHVG